MPSKYEVRIRRLEQAFTPACDVPKEFIEDVNRYFALVGRTDPNEILPPEHEAVRHGFWRWRRHSSWKDWMRSHVDPAEHEVRLKTALRTRLAPRKNS